jgi:hypothetical protein
VVLLLELVVSYPEYSRYTLRTLCGMCKDVQRNGNKM